MPGTALPARLFAKRLGLALLAVGCLALGACAPAGARVGEAGRSSTAASAATAADPSTSTTPSGASSKENTSMASVQTNSAPSTPTGAASPAAPVATQIAMFGAGCFWGVEATFAKVPGVLETAVGYAGGRTANPTYKEVCYEDTGHAEVVWIKFDPAKVSFDDLLAIFWKSHDPTQLNRQGPDVGDQYRSVVFAMTPEQGAAAKNSKAKLDASLKFRRPVATTIEPAATFHRAEEYHQRYLEKRGLDNCHLPPG